MQIFRYNQSFMSQVKLEKNRVQDLAGLRQTSTHNKTNTRYRAAKENY